MKRLINTCLSIVALVVFFLFVGCVSLAVYYFSTSGTCNANVEFSVKCAVPLGTLLVILAALFGKSFQGAWESGHWRQPKCRTRDSAS